tara:strand:- start:1026 stop:3044 length:2019 start_codon:yes stop_codon:yes gene_type:complete
MKLLKSFFILLTLIALIVFYDLAYYDPSYLNRSSITFSPNNLNSKKIKKLFLEFDKFYYRLQYKFSDRHKKFWAVENPIERKNLPKIKKIEGKKNNFLPGEKIENIEKNFSNWNRSHGGYYSMRFSSLKKINKENIHKLNVAWVYNSKDGKKGIQANPVINDGRVYFPTPGNYIVCLNGSTGKQIWKYKIEGTQPAKRGLLIWKDKKNNIMRLFFTNFNELIALNAKTGKPIKNFGKNGKIPIGSSPMTPTIIDNKLVIGTNRPAIEVYDVYTGDLEWKYYLGKTGKKTFNLRDFKSGVPWGGISSDNKNGIVYLTTGNPKPYYVGIKRPGKNLFSNSIIAFDIRNKKMLWHFQETCHDIWNFDIAAPPIITTINKNNKRIDVVIAVTKLGNTIILDRLSGESIFEYKMRLAPVSKFPGEKTCEYQPFFEIPEPFSRNIFKKEDITSRTEADRNYVISQVNKSNFGFFPTHEINKYTITYNINGGAQWTGGSVDPYKNVLYVSSNQIPYKIMVMGSFDINKNFKYETNLMKTEMLNGLDGYPGVKPPWGTLTAINLNNGKIIWQIPLGDHKNLKSYDNETGTLNFGGPTATASGLIFVGGTLDKLFRAFDSETGKELWSYKLPYIGSAPPSVYEINGEQYIIIPATGGYSLKQNYPDLVEQGDAFISFKIKN